MKFSVFQVSRKGGREKNEDRMGYCYTRSAALFLLADGMGGHPEGEVAAQLALQTIAALFQKETAAQIGDVNAFLENALQAAHRRILRYAIEKGMLDTPRTTVVVAVVQGGEVTWAHCGDSRFYLVRHDALAVRTRDHSYVEQRQDPARTGASTYGAQFNRNVLYTCLGSPAKPALEVSGPLQLMRGDRLMLCSDGLWDNVSDGDIARSLSRNPVSLSVPELVESALKRAGSQCDNVTAIAMEWETPDDLSVHGNVSTDSISDGVFASTVQSAWLDAAIDDLDDAAIERTIAEINEAIRRSAAKKRA